jgi:hypothetical protein
MKFEVVPVESIILTFTFKYLSVSMYAYDGREHYIVYEST